MKIIDRRHMVKFIKYLKYYGPYYTLIKSINYILRYKQKNKKPIVNHTYNLKDKPVIKGIDKDQRADILLVLCPPWDVSMPALGISYLSSYLKLKGFNPFVFDANIYLFNAISAQERKWWHQNMYDWWAEEDLFGSLYNNIFKDKLDKLVDNILSVDTRFIGFSVNFANRLFSIEVARQVKERDKSKIVILGGFGCITEHMRTLFPKEIVDIFVVGEGESTLFEILDTFKKEARLQRIEGAVVKNNGTFSNYGHRKPIMNLDSMPFPTFEEFYLHLFQQPILPILTSRGCIGKCSFCNDHEMSSPYRFRSAKNILAEIEFHIRNNKITNFSFKDLLCNGNTKELELLCDLVVQSNLKINWDSQAIPKKDMAYELLIKMKKSGCETLIYGVESCSNKVLRKMGKYFTKEDVKNVLRDTHRAGINTYVNIIVGFPGETEEDFLETCDFLKENRENIHKIGALSTCLVNNNTDLEYHPQKYGITLPDDARIRARAWYGQDGNTLELRKERLRKIMALLSEVGLDYECSNVPD